MQTTAGHELLRGTPVLTRIHGEAIARAHLSGRVGPIIWILVYSTTASNPQINGLRVDNGACVVLGCFSLWYGRHWITAFYSHRCSILIGIALHCDFYSIKDRIHEHLCMRIDVGALR
jgi:hypothetical protein